MKTQKGNVAVIVLIIVVIAITSIVIGWLFVKNLQVPVIQPIAQTQPVIQPVAASTSETKLRTELENIYSQFKDSIKDENYDKLISLFVGLHLGEKNKFEASLKYMNFYWADWDRFEFVKIEQQGDWAAYWNKLEFQENISNRVHNGFSLRMQIFQKVDGKWKVFAEPEIVGGDSENGISAEYQLKNNPKFQFPLKKLQEYEQTLINKQRADASIDVLLRPDLLKAQEFNIRFIPKSIPSISVMHNNTWTEIGGDYLRKYINERLYLIGFQEKPDEFFDSRRGGNTQNAKLYTENAKPFSEILVNKKPHFIFISNNKNGYLSSCEIKGNEACSPKLQNGNHLFVFVQTASPNDAEYDRKLDFSRNDDQQILAEFAEIMSTLSY